MERRGDCRETGSSTSIMSCCGVGPTGSVWLGNRTRLFAPNPNLVVFTVSNKYRAVFVHKNSVRPR